ncbi:uridine diphosphate-N-acetylglucosamine-binding protein YvcK [Limosilactobacillus mucosae]|uniref:Putative gluconeogenesis factor n=1 Tax=Limosilactobacillus mucosae TaxID=97478 RepID=A0AAJ1HTQ7_LIMMU|nr:uridine diphosphate-N-acetylglucosamine-binding protein YvcK [Limosilactobacillus mucosae]MDD6454328.1 uridine diphosphate-N-acetylglucosamine-binding protein YvcK [Lactobacillus sp.]MDC2829329.1 uridine diphosphate-N-acetylglucosamine-binding protein YvcK [Limosilactobacillus mucosae]MDC2837012.1 uridine diphosphate-N-acetylglucosamine-binding protein YvcK [Limosilactobacillus mucosae]MDC2839013.1 uridine diphosphate-N-acetylglucosamine-binding protein YvcK [Limosilactobacillus mucosae]MDC
MIHKPKIVMIGGGTGLPEILHGLRDKDVDVTAIVTVADDGGSSGILRDYVNVVPPGDIRNALVALSELSELELSIFQYRFNSTDQFLAGHAIGNLIISALAEMKGGDIFAAVQELSSLMKIKGHIYPVTDEPLTLNAEFTDGSTLSGESEITAAHKRIQRVWITPSNNENHHQAKAVKQVIDAIMDADQIVLGPGSLFTSILPNLMIENVGRAVCETKAEVVYICNIMTQKGETDNFSDADHVRVLNSHLKQNFIDTVLVNIQPVPKDYIDFQEWNEISQPVKHDFQGLRDMGCRVISSNFLRLRDNGAFHDRDKVVAELLNRLHGVHY